MNDEDEEFIESLDVPLVHICENCGVEKILTPREAFDEGWDYPPLMGVFGVLSPRTCGNCAITTTLWWRLVTLQSTNELTEHDKEVLTRVDGEPESIQVREGA